MKHFFTTLALAASLSACGTMHQGHAEMPASARDGILTDSQGMSLYTFDKDSMDKSACNGPCAANWPPLSATQESMAHGPWSIIMRDDGSRQWAFKGKPLYRWIKDQKPGDRTGDGFRDVWHLARP